MEDECINTIMTLSLATKDKIEKSLNELGGSLDDLEKISKENNCDPEEILDILGVLANVGISGAEAGKRLYSVFKEIENLIKKGFIDPDLDFFDVIKEVRNRNLSMSQIACLFGQNNISTILYLKNEFINFHCDRLCFQNKKRYKEVYNQE